MLAPGQMTNEAGTAIAPALLLTVRLRSLLQKKQRETRDFSPSSCRSPFPGTLRRSILDTRPHFVWNISSRLNLKPPNVGEVNASLSL